MTNTLLTEANLPRPIQDGDSGIVLTKDGGWFVFSCNPGLTMDSKPTPIQKTHAEILQALAVALKVPQLLDILKQAANDPNIVGTELLDKKLAH